jgi:hypothetical protein
MRVPEDSKDTVFVTVQAAPPIFVFICGDVDSLMRAVRFASNMWGAGTSVMLPLPTDAAAIEEFWHTLAETNPDFIVIACDLPTEVEERINSLPNLSLRLRDGVADEVAEQRAQFEVAKGYPAHLIEGVSALLPLRSQLILPPSDGFYLKELRLMGGWPSAFTSDGLSAATRTATLGTVSNTEGLVKSAILMADGESVRSIAQLGAYRRLEGLGNLAGHLDENFLWIFLSDEADIRAAAAYWNLSGFARKNRLLLPKVALTVDVERTADVIASAIRSTKNIRLVAHVPKGVASRLQKGLATAFSTAYSRPIDVDVLYAGFDYATENVVATFEPPQSSRQAISDNRSVRIEATPPTGLRERPRLFAVRAEIRTSDGASLSLPDTIATANIFTVNHWWIKNTKREDWKALLVQASVPPLRGSERGIRTLQLGRRIDNKEIVVSTRLPRYPELARLYFRQHGFEIDRNEASSMVNGVVARMESPYRNAEWLEQLDVLSALLGNDGKPQTKGGPEIIQRFASIRGIPAFQKRKNTRKKTADSTTKEENPSEQVGRALGQLLRRGLVERVVAVVCERCEYRSWHTLKDLDELISCPGCLSPTPIGVLLDPQYRLSSIVQSCFANGGRAVMMALWNFNQFETPGITLTGGGFVHKGNALPKIDADVIRLSHEEIAIVECKDWYFQSDGRQAKLEESVKRGIMLVKALGTRALYLCVYSEPATDVTRMVKRFTKIAKGDGVEFRLFIRDRLLVWNDKKKALESANVAGLHWVRSGKIRTKWVGKEKRSHGGSGFTDYFERGVIAQWLGERAPGGMSE